MSTAPSLVEDGQIRAIDPRNFSIVDSFAIDALDQLPDRIARCRTAQVLWAQLPLKERLDAVAFESCAEQLASKTLLLRP